MVGKTFRKATAWRLAVTGLALWLVAGPSFAQANAPRENAQRLEKVLAQTTVNRLAAVLAVRESEVKQALQMEAEIRKRVSAGVVRGTDLEEATANEAEAEIALHAAHGSLQAALTRYTERFNEDIAPAAINPAPAWQSRLPNSAAAALSRARPGDEADAQRAWQRLQRADAVVALHERRVQALDRRREAFSQQFAIGQRSLGEFNAASRLAADARIDWIGAQADRLQAQATLLGASGQLTATDLAAPLGEGKAYELPDIQTRLAALRAPAAVGAGSVRPVEPRPAPAPAPSSPPPPPPAAAPAPAPAPLPPRASARPPGLVVPVPATVPTRPSVDHVELAPAAGAPTPVGAAPRPAARPTPAANSCGDTDEAEAGLTDGLRNFEWPPAAWSYEAPVPRNFLREEEGSTTLGQVGRTLVRALEKAGYSYAFLAVPNGFALVTRMEQILPDGSRSKDAWSRALPRTGELGFSGFLQALFKAPMGRYRVIAFAVTDASYNRNPDRAAPSEERVENWFDCGETQLPPPIAKRPFSEDVKATAFIYEFAKSSEREAAVSFKDPRMTARDHLVKSGIWDNLSFR